MKYTQYFLFARQRPDRIAIKEEWLGLAMNTPLKTETQIDGRIKKWVYVPETGKYLRVIFLDDGETVHNAFFDRNFKEDSL